MFDGHWRDTVGRGTAPVGATLQKMGVTADLLTATGLISATATAVAIGSGHLLVAVCLLLLTGLHDLLDGPVAKAAGTESVRGAFFDSVTDRVTDALLFGGVAWYVDSRSGGHLVLLPVAVLAVSLIVSYQRAKAESLGLSAKGGLMERAERIVLLGIGLLASAVLVPVLWLLLVLTSVTACGRFLKVWRQATVLRAPAPATTPALPADGGTPRPAEAVEGTEPPHAAEAVHAFERRPDSRRRTWREQTSGSARPWRTWREQTSGSARPWRTGRLGSSHSQHRAVQPQGAELRSRRRARRRREMSDRRFLARWTREGGSPRSSWRSLREGERAGWSSDRRRS